MPRVQLPFFLFLLFFSQSQLLFAQTDEVSAFQNEQPGFFSIVTRSFERWDLNHDGVLEPREVDHALMDAENRGLDACALSALHVNLKKSEPKLYDRAYFSALQLNAKLAKPFLARFKKSQTKLSRSSRELFAAGAPHLESMHQGKTGDCYFLSALGSMVSVNPEKVRQMIRLNQDGSYTVSFFGKEPVTVNGPTDGEIAAFADAYEDGLWLSVIEKAFAKLKISANPDENEDQMYQAISGGAAGSVIKLLTGHKCRRYSFEKPENRKEIRPELARAFAEGRLVNTGIKSLSKSGRLSGHALAVIDYDPSNDTVKIWNPWGTTKSYASVGLLMQNGIFSMPVDDWLNRFSGVTFELNKNL
ncbi:MAG: hypothetical protein K2X27_00770 [Candidatus Obscuribacterales bacterium]|nr:hypothetical protein [Candidatus Obscuribacterales bacterium]